MQKDMRVYGIGLNKNKGDKMRLVITGSKSSRNFTKNKEIIEKGIEKLGRPDEIYTGKKVGTDIAVKWWGEKNGIKVVVVEPEWSKYGGKGGYIATLKMIDGADGLVFIWDGVCREVYTCIREARKRNIKMYGFNLRTGEEINE